VLSFKRWLTGRDFRFNSEGRAPLEAVVLRSFGLAYLTVILVDTFATKPRPGFDGRGLVILLATAAMVAATVAALKQPGTLPTLQRFGAIALVTACSGFLAAAQPNGIWEAGPVFVGIIAAIQLDRRSGALALLLAIVVVAVVSSIEGHGGRAFGAAISAIPWFLVIRLMRELRDQRDELNTSRAAEARAAAAAERGKLAREMHDVLAHSLSALALQLESTRLLARDRGADEDVIRGLDRAHHLAASGLQEARRAIATARGDELPGADRLEALADAFGQQSGLPVELAISGEPRELGTEAGLAVYRTAQEALTNVRRHATAERVEVSLAYLPDRTVLVVEDHALNGTPPPVAPALGLAGGGFGLTGMRERAELLGGALHVEPTIDGFRVELRLPE
jgi:signal transduction histidine kinase